MNNGPVSILRLFSDISCRFPPNIMDDSFHVCPDLTPRTGTGIGPFDFGLSIEAGTLIFKEFVLMIITGSDFSSVIAEFLN